LNVFEIINLSEVNGVSNPNSTQVRLIFLKFY